MQYILRGFLVLFLFSTAIGHTQGGVDKEKSVIVITQPNQNTIWTIPDKVKLEWSTIGIDSLKSIRFFLVRDEVVVQELGSFRNTHFKEGIRLAKNIGSGNTYHVVGMELFPDDKYRVAKFVTPFFTIVNPESDERKRIQQQAHSRIAAQQIKKTKKKKRKKKVPLEAKVATATNNEIKTYTRQEFDGRKISYKKELTFDTENISLKIWDHGKLDGDIVSIYLNGAPVVHNYHLTYLKKELKIKLNANISNDLFLYAHNLGTAPPNTVSMEITNGKNSENIILNSDLQSCEAVLISVKK